MIPKLLWFGPLKAWGPCASPQSLSMGRYFFLVFSRFLPLCQSNNVSSFPLSLLFSWYFATRRSLHPDIHQPSTFCIDVFINLLVLASGPSEKTYRKKPALWPTSAGTPIVQIWRNRENRGKTDLPKMHQNKQRFVVQNSCLSQCVYSPKVCNL